MQVHNCKSCHQCLPAVFQQERSLASEATQAEVLLEAPRSGALNVPRNSHRSSEGGLAVAVIQESLRQSYRQEEGGPSVAATQERLLSATPSATRGPHLQADEGLDGAAIEGATLKPRRLAEGGIDVACSQARSKQVKYLNAQQAHLECEIEKEFLSGYHAKQNYDDLSDVAPVEVTTPESQPSIADEMLMLLSISGSANLQHRLRLLCREFSDIFSSTVRERPAVVPPLSMSVNKER